MGTPHRPLSPSVSCADSVARAAVTALANVSLPTASVRPDKTGVFGGWHGVTGRDRRPRGNLCHASITVLPVRQLRRPSWHPRVDEGRMPNTTHHCFPSNDQIKTHVSHPRRHVSRHQASSHSRPNNHVPRRDCSPPSLRSLRRAPFLLHKCLA